MHSAFLNVNSKNTPIKFTKFSRESNKTKLNFTTAKSTGASTFLKQDSTNTGHGHAPYWPANAP